MSVSEWASQRVDDGTGIIACTTSTTVQSFEGLYLCMCMYLCMCLYLCMFMYLHAHAFVYVFVYVYADGVLPLGDGSSRLR